MIFYPIHDIIPDREGHGVVIGKNGSLTYVVRLSSPEVYSLYKDELATRHAVFVQAFSHMPDNSWVHKQDISEVFPSSQPVWGCRIWPNLIRNTFQEGNISSTAV